MSRPNTILVITALLLAITVSGLFPACKKAAPPAPESRPAPAEKAASQGIPAPSIPAPTMTIPPAKPVPLPVIPPAQPGTVPGMQPQFEPLMVMQSFYLDVTAPADSIVVKEGSIKVEGGTPPGSVVTVNGKIVALNGTARFSTDVPLEEGPNSIEIVASDFLGNQRSMVISLIRLSQ